MGVQYGIRDLANEKESTKPSYPDTNVAAAQAGVFYSMS
jgi:hypothetical protein